MSCGLVTARPAKTVMTELAQQTLKAQSLTCKQACSYLIEKDGTGHVAHLLILVPAPRQQRQDTGVYSSFTSCNDEIKPLCLTLNALGPWDEVARLPVAEVNVVPQDGNIQQLPHILALVVPCYAMRTALHKCLHECTHRAVRYTHLSGPCHHRQTSRVSWQAPSVYASLPAPCSHMHVSPL